MSLKSLRDEIDDEVSTILDSEFRIDVTETKSVPHSGDPAITFPNLDAQTQGAKLIDTCVLYIDIRRSTDLNLTHRPQTVARLYSAFVRAMTHTARHYGGHVRGIIGDRVMVIFDKDDAFKNSVDCSIAMNSIAKYVINNRFKANEVECGIGIDSGKMLATKTGIRRHGHEQGNYRNLVWLGRPANVASKLTDLANKSSETIDVPMVRVAYEQPIPGMLGAAPPSNPFSLGMLGVAPPGSPLSLGSSNPFETPNLLSLMRPSSPPGLLGLAAQAAPADNGWRWVDEQPIDFLSNLEIEYNPKRLRHKDPTFASFFETTNSVLIREKTPAILMTEVVWLGYKRAQPQRDAVQKKLFKSVAVKIPGYTGKVYGGNVIFTDLQG